jgi:hypothetical protein
MSTTLTTGYENQIKLVRDAITASILANFPKNAYLIKVEGVAIEYNLGKDDNREVYAMDENGTLFVHTSFDNDDDFEDFPFGIEEDDDDYPEYEENISTLDELELDELLNLLRFIEEGIFEILE